MIKLDKYQKIITKNLSNKKIQSVNDFCINLFSTIILKSDKESVCLHKGMVSALMDVCVALSRQFPFKKKIYYIKGVDPFFDKPMAWMSLDVMLTNLSSAPVMYIITSGRNFPRSRIVL